MSNSCLSLKHHQLSTSKQIHWAKKKKKKRPDKTSSSSQAWLAYLYVCLSAAVQLQVIKSALWWDADKGIRRDDVSGSFLLRSGVKSLHYWMKLFLQDFPFSPRHRVTLCLYYALEPHERCNTSCGLRWQQRTLKFDRANTAARLKQRGQSAWFQHTKTYTRIQQTYTVHKTCEGEQQQARWHVKLPRWCIA